MRLNDIFSTPRIPVFSTQLKENYVGSLTGQFKDFIEVFVNPDSKELRDLSKDANIIRFIADAKERKVYMWDGEELHLNIIESLLPEYYQVYFHGTQEGTVLIGTGILHGTKAYMTNADALEYDADRFFDGVESAWDDMVEKGLLTDWSWAGAFIDISSAMEELRNVIEVNSDKEIAV